MDTRHNKLYLTHVNTRFAQGSQMWDCLPNDLIVITSFSEEVKTITDLRPNVK